MQIPLKLTVTGAHSRKACLIEQGIPVPPMDRADVAKLALTDEDGSILPANIEHDGRDENDKTVWIRLTTCVDIPKSKGRHLAVVSLDRPALPTNKIKISSRKAGISIETPHYSVEAKSGGQLRIATAQGDIVNGKIDFQIWSDARSIIGAGGGTNRLAFFEPDEWTIEEQMPTRCLLVLKGHIPKYAAYTGDPNNKEAENYFACELEIQVNVFSNILRYRWRTENMTSFQAYLERYALAIPLAPWASVKSGEKSDDGKYLRWVQARTPGGTLGLTANFVDVLGAGAGISAERRESMGNLTSEDILEYMRSSGTDLFEPHKYLAATKDTTATLDLLTGGINPPQDGTQWALNPDVHRLFYRGMGRTFDGALIVNPVENEIADELDPIYFEVPPDYYSEAGALPEDGDPVGFGEFKDLIYNAAEWMLKKQWRGTLWWGEWWREYDVFRKQGIEATANGNNPLGPLFHYWRTGDTRFIDCAKRAMEYEYDIQLCKKGSTSPVPFFHSRRYLMDQMEWVHMRYQRIEGPIKAAHFFGDRRLRTKIIDAMRAYSEVMVLKDGGPGFWENDKRKVSLAGSDCTNFGEVLGICYKETGEEHFLDKAKRMANWTIRVMNKWDWDAYIGNSYGWHFLMRGMLSTLKLTGNKRYKDWYIDMARRNLTYDLDEMDFRPWMDWLLAEAGRLSPKDESWFLDEMKRRTICKNSEITPEGAVFDRCNYPWSKFPSLWQRLYDQKTIVCYIPVLTARRKALGMEP